MLDFLRNNFRWIAGGFLLTLFSSFGQTFFISASIAEWQTAFDLSHGEIGRLYMLATLASAMCLPVIGRMVDVLPEHQTLAIVIPALAGATLLAAFAPSVIVLAIAIFLLRLFGQGMMSHVALTATGRWFDAQRGRAVSLVVLGNQAGEATLPLAFAGLATGYGFRTGWVAGAVTLIVVCLPLALWAYRKPRLPKPAASEPGHEEAKLPVSRNWTRREVLLDPVFWVLLVGVLAPPFIGTTIFYHQDYLTEISEWPPTLFARSLILMAGTTVLVALITGAVIDRFRAVAVLPWFLLPLAATCFLLASGGPPAWLYLVMLLLGISYGVSSTLFGAIWPEVYGTAHLGAIRSLVVSVMVFATAAGPGLTGTLIDFGFPLRQQIGFLGAYCLLATAAMALVSMRLRTHRLPPLPAR